MHEVQDKLEETGTLKLQQASLKGEYEDIEIQLQKKEEQVKSSNKRFIYIQKKMEKLSKENKIYEEKNHILENERKKLSEKYQNLVSRVKGEEKLRAKNRELEDNLEAATQEIEGLLERLRDSLKRTEDLQNILNNEIKANEQIKDMYKKLKIQEKLLMDERDLLANMNKEQSIKINLLQENLIKNSSPKKQESPQKVEQTKTPKDSKILLRLNQKLEENIAKVENELSVTKEKLQRKEQEVVELELKLNESHKERRKLEQRQREVPKESISGFIKCLDNEVEHPINALNYDESSSLLQEMNEKYDRLLDKYQVIEEARNNLEEKLLNSQHIIKSLRTQINEDIYKNATHEKILIEKTEEIEKLREKTSILEEKLKYCGLSAETERHIEHREILRCKSSINRASSMHNLSDKKTKMRSNTPDDAATPRYFPIRSNSNVKGRTPSQQFEKTPWKH